MPAHSSASGRRRTPDPRLPVPASRLLRVRALWVIPLVVGAVLVAAIAGLYIGSVVNPVAHLRGLPVAVVNQDLGAVVGSRHLQIGRQVQAGLQASPAVSSKLSLDVMTLPQAEQAMDSDDLYATLVIPPGFTASLLNVAGLHVAGAVGGAAPQVEILNNQRAGTLGNQLATGVLQPALAVASHRIGRQLAALVPPGAQPASTQMLLANPVTVTTTPYRPLPPGAALGLSAFYVALLTLMCGFLGGTIVNSVVDSALGYATTELGPRWRQRQPVPINRWQTLLIKLAITAVLTAVLVGVMLLVAWGLGMDMPHAAALWAYTWLCAASVGVGMITLFAVAGNYGQLIGLLVFVYAGLASAGGTVPVQALPGFLRLLSNIEPLRQVLEGTRSILYFDAQADAGLTRGILAASLGLVFWLVIATVVVRWYDRKGLYRLQPDLLAHVDKAVHEYKAEQTGPDPSLRRVLRFADERVPQPGVDATEVQQFLVRADLGDLSVVKDHDAVGARRGGQPVGDHNRGPRRGELPGSGGDGRLRRQVECRGRLVEQEDVGVGELRPGQGDELPLTGRQVPAPLTHLVVVAVRQPHDHLVRADGPRRRDHLVERRLRPRVGDRLRDCAAEQVRLLRHHSEPVPE